MGGFVISQDQENDVKKLKKEQHIVAFLDILGLRIRLKSIQMKNPIF